MADQKISVTYFNTGKKKRMSRCDSVDECIQRIQRQFSLEGSFSLKAKIGEDEYDIETEQDADDLLEADELIVYSKEETVVNADKLVKIEDEEFRIDVIPLRTATIVQRHRNLLIHDLDLPGMVKELQDLKNFLRLAYYGTATSADAQIEVQDVGFTVTKLCEHSKLTLGMFASSCGDILEKLRCAHLYLIDGVDDMTLLNLKSVADISKRMTLASADLKKLFDEGVESAKCALVATQKEQAVQQKLKTDTVTQKREATEEKGIKEGDLPRYDMLLDVSIEEVNCKESALNYERHKENKISESEYLPKFLAKLLEGIEVPSATAQKELSEAIEKKQMVTKKKIETNEKIRRFINTIQTLEETEEIVECAIRALHKAVSGMKGLSDIMLKAELFWTSLSTVVENMMSESDSLKDKVTTSAEYEGMEKSRLWRSETFKVEAVTYLSVWVAVMDICSAHKGDMENVTKGLHEFLRENPTREEAAVKITDICWEFEKHLDASDEELKRKQQSIEDELKRRQLNQRPAAADRDYSLTHHSSPPPLHENEDQENAEEETCISPIEQWCSLLDLMTGSRAPQTELNGRYKSKSDEHLISRSDHKNKLLEQTLRPRLNSAPSVGKKRSREPTSQKKCSSPKKPSCPLSDLHHEVGCCSSSTVTYCGQEDSTHMTSEQRLRNANLCQSRHNMTEKGPNKSRKVSEHLMLGNYPEKTSRKHWQRSPPMTKTKALNTGRPWKSVDSVSHPLPSNMSNTSATHSSSEPANLKHAQEAAELWGPNLAEKQRRISSAEKSSFTLIDRGEGGSCANMNEKNIPKAEKRKQGDTLNHLTSYNQRPLPYEEFKRHLASCMDVVTKQRESLLSHRPLARNRNRENFAENAVGVSKRGDKEVIGNLSGMLEKFELSGGGQDKNPVHESPMKPPRHTPASTTAEDLSNKQKSTKCSESRNPVKTTRTRRSGRQNVALAGLRSRKPELSGHSCLRN